MDTVSSCSGYKFTRGEVQRTSYSEKKSSNMSMFSNKSTKKSRVTQGNHDLERKQSFSQHHNSWNRTINEPTFPVSGSDSTRLKDALNDDFLCPKYVRNDSLYGKKFQLHHQSSSSLDLEFDRSSVFHENNHGIPGVDHKLNPHLRREFGSQGSIDFITKTDVDFLLTRKSSKFPVVDQHSSIVRETLQHSNDNDTAAAVEETPSRCTSPKSRPKRLTSKLWGEWDRPSLFRKLRSGSKGDAVTLVNDSVSIKSDSSRDSAPKQDVIKEKGKAEIGDSLDVYANNYLSGTTKSGGLGKSFMTTPKAFGKSSSMRASALLCTSNAYNADTSFSGTYCKVEADDASNDMGSLELISDSRLSKTLASSSKENFELKELKMVDGVDGTSCSKSTISRSHKSSSSSSSKTSNTKGTNEFSSLSLEKGSINNSSKNISSTNDSSNLKNVENNNVHKITSNSVVSSTVKSTKAKEKDSSSTNFLSNISSAPFQPHQSGIITSCQQAEETNLALNAMANLYQPALVHHDIRSMTSVLSPDYIQSIMVARSNTITGATAASIAFNNSSNAPTVAVIPSSSDSTKCNSSLLYSNAEENANVSEIDHTNYVARTTAPEAGTGSVASPTDTLVDVDSIEKGDGRSNELLLSCPYFCNELGGEIERVISLTRVCNINSSGKDLSLTRHMFPSNSRTNSLSNDTTTSAHNSTSECNLNSLYISKNPCQYVQRPSSAACIGVIEPEDEDPDNDTPVETTPKFNLNVLKPEMCPYAKVPVRIEELDPGTDYYERYFYGKDHQNYFGVDDSGFGPVAVSYLRQRITLDNATSVSSVSGLSSSEGKSNSNPNFVPCFLHRLIIRTAQMNSLQGSVIECTSVDHNFLSSSKKSASSSTSSTAGSSSTSSSIAVSGSTKKSTSSQGSVVSGGGTGSSSALGSGGGGGPGLREVLEHVCPKLPTSCLYLGVQPDKTRAALHRVDTLSVHRQFKVGVLYCCPNQTTEEQMYGNKDGGPAFEEFLALIGQRIRLKDFDKYRAGLDKNTDSTGEYSVYSTYQGCEVMFHVSTLLPFTPTNTKQLLRKRHIGNDIVTIIFQEEGSEPFSPHVIRSHFQHVFIIVRVSKPCTSETTYSVAVSRFHTVMSFSPPLPSPAVFTKGKTFTSFLLAKIINGELATLRSEKFSCLATRTRIEYLKDLAINYCTTTPLDPPNKFSLMGFSRGLSSRRDKSRSITFSPSAAVTGASTWSMFVTDNTLHRQVLCRVGLSPAVLVVVEASTSLTLLCVPTPSVLAWTTSSGTGVKVFYHQGECLTLSVPRSEGGAPGLDPDTALEVTTQITARLEAVTQGAHTQELLIQRQRGSSGSTVGGLLLGFNVQQDGVVTEVSQCGPAYATGLRPWTRILEICTVPLSTLSQEAMVDLLKTSQTVSLTIVPPHQPDREEVSSLLSTKSPRCNITPRRGCNVPTCAFHLNDDAATSDYGDYENLSSPDSSGSGVTAAAGAFPRTVGHVRGTTGSRHKSPGAKSDKGKSRRHHHKQKSVSGVETSGSIGEAAQTRVIGGGAVTNSGVGGSVARSTTLLEDTGLPAHQVLQLQNRYDRSLSPPRSSNSSGYGTGNSAKSFSMEPPLGTACSASPQTACSTHPLIAYSGPPQGAAYPYYLPHPPPPGNSRYKNSFVCSSNPPAPLRHRGPDTDLATADMSNSALQPAELRPPAGSSRIDVASSLSLDSQRTRFDPCSEGSARMHGNSPSVRAAASESIYDNNLRHPSFPPSRQPLYDYLSQDVEGQPAESIYDNRKEEPLYDNHYPNRIQKTPQKTNPDFPTSGTEYLDEYGRPSSCVTPRKPSPVSRSPSAFVTLTPPKRVGSCTNQVTQQQVSQNRQHFASQPRGHKAAPLYDDLPVSMGSYTKNQPSFKPSMMGPPHSFHPNVRDVDRSGFSNEFGSAKMEVIGIPILNPASVASPPPLPVRILQHKHRQEMMGASSPTSLTSSSSAHSGSSSSPQQLHPQDRRTQAASPYCARSPKPEPPSSSHFQSTLGAWQKVAMRHSESTVKSSVATAKLKIRQEYGNYAVPSKVVRPVQKKDVRNNLETNLDEVYRSDSPASTAGSSSSDPHPHKVVPNLHQTLNRNQHISGQRDPCGSSPRESPMLPSGVREPLPKLRPQGNRSVSSKGASTVTSTSASTTRHSGHFSGSSLQQELYKLINPEDGSVEGEACGESRRASPSALATKSPDYSDNVCKYDSGSSRNVTGNVSSGASTDVSLLPFGTRSDANLLYSNKSYSPLKRTDIAASHSKHLGEIIDDSLPNFSSVNSNGIQCSTDLMGGQIQAVSLPATCSSSDEGSRVQNLIHKFTAGDLESCSMHESNFSSEHFNLKASDTNMARSNDNAFVDHQDDTAYSNSKASEISSAQSPLEILDRLRGGIRLAMKTGKLPSVTCKASDPGNIDTDQANEAGDDKHGNDAVQVQPSSKENENCIEEEWNSLVHAANNAIGGTSQALYERKLVAGEFSQYQPMNLCPARYPRLQDTSSRSLPSCVSETQGKLNSSRQPSSLPSQAGDKDYACIRKVMTEFDEQRSHCSSYSSTVRSRTSPLSTPSSDFNSSVKNEEENLYERIDAAVSVYPLRYNASFGQASFNNNVPMRNAEQLQCSRQPRCENTVITDPFYETNEFIRSDTLNHNQTVGPTTNNNNNPFEDLEKEDLRNRILELEQQLKRERCIGRELNAELSTLRDINMRLQEDSRAAARQLHQFTEWFFANIDDCRKTQKP